MLVLMPGAALKASSKNRHASHRWAVRGYEQNCRFSTELMVHECCFWLKAGGFDGFLAEGGDDEQEIYPPRHTFVGRFVHSDETLRHVAGKPEKPS